MKKSKVTHKFSILHLAILGLALAAVFFIILKQNYPGTPSTFAHSLLSRQVLLQSLTPTPTILPSKDAVAKAYLPLVISNTMAQESLNAEEWDTYSSADWGISINYPKSFVYVLGSARSDIHRVYLVSFIDKQYISDSLGKPRINLAIYENPKSLSISDWFVHYQQLRTTNRELVARGTSRYQAINTIEINGQQGVSYKEDLSWLGEDNTINVLLATADGKIIRLSSSITLQPTFELMLQSIMLLNH